MVGDGATTDRNASVQIPKGLSACNVRSDVVAGHKRVRRSEEWTRSPEQNAKPIP